MAGSIDAALENSGVSLYMSNGVLVGDMLFGLSHRNRGFSLEDDAELVISRVNAGAFQELKRYTVAKGATWAQPVVSGNRVFVKDVSPPASCL